ncbi:MAG TPA: hypothetical protein VF884_15240 [Nitrososphaeraceae archaeon]
MLFTLEITSLANAHDDVLTNSEFNYTKAWKLETITSRVGPVLTRCTEIVETMFYLADLKTISYRQGREMMS